MSTDITVSVRVPAPRPEVWRALTVEVGLRPWWWAHAGDVEFFLPDSVNERFRISSRNLGITVTGWLLEQDPPKRHVVTWLWDGDVPPEEGFDKVTITLEPEDFDTIVNVHHTTHQADPEALEQGWRDTLAALVALYDNRH